MTDDVTVQRRALRTAAERLEKDIRTVTFHLSVWEGREGWANHPAAARAKHGQEGYEALDALIDELGDLRLLLRAELRPIPARTPTTPLNDARYPDDEGWDELTGWQQGVRYHWDADTVHDMLLAEFTTLAGNGDQDATQARYSEVADELGEAAAAALWDEAREAVSVAEQGVEVEFMFESGETRKRRVLAVPRVGEALVWMSTDVYPDKPDEPFDTETGFVVSAVQWTLYEPDGGQVTEPDSWVRVSLERGGEPRPKAGETPPWMGLDRHDTTTAWSEAKNARVRAEKALDEARQAERAAAIADGREPAHDAREG